MRVNLETFRNYIDPLIEKNVRVAGDDFVQTGVLVSAIIHMDPWAKHRFSAKLRIENGNIVTVEFDKMTDVQEWTEPEPRTMQKLSTIQKRENLNEVYRYGNPGPGGAYHDYDIYPADYTPLPEVALACIEFQKGPRNDPSSRAGVLDTDLLEIVRDRLKAFQSGPYACRENEMALYGVEMALMWMNRRVEDRIERNVLGTMEV